MTSPAGSAAEQVALVATLERWERMETLAQLFTEVPALQREADRRYLAMMKVCLSCGFEPGGRHSHMTSLEFARMRAVTVRKVLPNHLKGGMR